jgi:hypothetical protein
MFTGSSHRVKRPLAGDAAYLLGCELKVSASTGPMALRPRANVAEPFVLRQTAAAGRSPSTGDLDGDAHTLDPDGNVLVPRRAGDRITVRDVRQFVQRNAALHPRSIRAVIVDSVTVRQ